LEYLVVVRELHYRASKYDFLWSKQPEAVSFRTMAYTNIVQFSFYCSLEDVNEKSKQLFKMVRFRTTLLL